MSARISSAKRRRTRLRSRGSVRRHAPCSKVLRAPVTAASTSAASAARHLADHLPVDGADVLEDPAILGGHVAAIDEGAPFGFLCGSELVPAAAVALCR